MFRNVIPQIPTSSRLDIRAAVARIRQAGTVRTQRLLAISSGGGHWIEMLRLQPAFEGFDVTYATVGESYRCQVDDAKFCTIPNANSSDKWALIVSAVHVLWLVLTLRPAVVVSTGAAPGYLAIFFGRWIGAKTIWVDSIANAEELSLSGRLAGRLADLWLTQWPHLSRLEGPVYRGSIL